MGSGAPASGTGDLDDLYLNTANGDYYQKDGSGWQLVGNLRAPVQYDGIGQLIDLQSFSAATLRNYLLAVGTTITSASNELNIAGIATVATTNTTNLPFDHSSEKWRLHVRFRANVTTGTQRIGIGKRSTHFRNATGTRKSLSLLFDFASDSADKGKMFVFTGANDVYTQRAISSAITCNNNDLIDLTLTLTGNVVEGVAINLTDSSTSTITYTYQLQNTSDPILPNTGRPCIFNLHQAALRVLRVKFEELTPAKPYLLIIGDSKSTGYNTTANADRFITQLQTAYPGKVEAWTGFGNELGDAMMWMSIVRRIRPENVLIALGCNDRRNNVTDVVLTQNLERLRDAFEAVGSTVWFLNMGEGSINHAILNARAIGLFGPEYCIFTEPALAADNVHLTTAGHNTVKDAIVAKLFS